MGEPSHDAELKAQIEAARTGDRQAFDTIEAQYRQGMYQFCCRFLSQHEDVQDATQETFKRAWENMATFRGDAAFRTWLWDIAQNVCLNLLRARKNKLTQQTLSIEALSSNELKKPWQIPDKSPTPEEVVLAASYYARLRQAIEAKADARHWNELDWELFVLRIEEQITFAEFAKRRGRDADYWRNRWREKIKEAVLDRVREEFGES